MAKNLKAPILCSNVQKDKIDGLFDAYIKYAAERIEKSDVDVTIGKIYKCHGCLDSCDPLGLKEQMADAMSDFCLDYDVKEKRLTDKYTDEDFMFGLADYFNENKH